MRGKYADVLEKYGRAGFGLPELAPKSGSFPLYPIRRARYALAIVASDVYDAHPDERRRVIAAALHAHPSLATEARHVRATVRTRRNPEYAWKERSFPTQQRQKYTAHDLALTLDGGKMIVSVLPQTVTETVRDRNIPSEADVTNDFELFADGIPELVAQGEQALRDRKKWVAQGWWPRPVTKQKWKVVVYVRPIPFKEDGSVELESTKTFDTAAQAKAEVEAILPKLVQRRRPAWLAPIQRQNPRVRTNMKAPYWFVSEGSGFRLLERGEPTSTTYRSIAAAKADVSERNNTFRAKRKKNPTAWQKAMRKTSAPTRSKFEITSIEYIRAGTYGLDLDLGKDGYGRVTVYPDGELYASGVIMTPALREKIEKWLHKHAKKIQAVPEFQRVQSLRWNPIGADWKEAAERLLARRTGKTMDDLHYRAYLRAVISGHTGQATHMVQAPFIGALEARDDLIDEYGKGPVRRNGRKR
jgi:hypothetical protein